ncbi:concanavalin A-like lectin/glucanase domain-containing protein [Cyathus striatus]|nr:concanavalin A-like lectin/glucanase domain-containing protein [Cyathus striatus]
MDLRYLKPCFSTLLLLLLQNTLPAKATTYNLAREYSGDTFFDGWAFTDKYDSTTNGDVLFLSESVAKSSGLAYIDDSTKHAIIKVDNTSTVVWNNKRNSVRITTEESYDIGSVWVADIYHAPYGCSVWPALWTYATDTDWPLGGEIDIFEGINMWTTSQMGLHSSSGCTQMNPTELSTYITSTDCAGDGNAGCMVLNTDSTSYGAAFAAAQGGIYVTEMAETGISVWYFSRASVPSSISSSNTTIDTSALGTPMGHWPSTGCDISKFFHPQNLIFTITLCGDLAGDATLFSQTCEGLCYNDYVLGDGSNYDTAYFEVASVRIFSSNSTTTSTSGEVIIIPQTRLYFVLASALLLTSSIW